MKAIALALISGYQNYLSPYKGFSCAYRAHTGCTSCSALGYRAIRMKGLFKGIGILNERLHVCGIAHRRSALRRNRPPLLQRGDCDFGCVDLPFDNCGGGGGKTGANLCEAIKCLDVFTCDWFSNDKKKRKGRSEADVPLPSRRDS